MIDKDYTERLEQSTFKQAQTITDLNKLVKMMQGTIDKQSREIERFKDIARTSPNEDSERKLFEKWYAADAMSSESNWFERYAEGDYKLVFVENSWQGWFAAKSTRTKQDHMVSGGVFGSVEYSLEDKTYRGKILNINDLITYESDSLEGLHKSFADEVQDWHITRATIIPEGI